MAIDLGYSYCSNVVYGVAGYTWAVADYSYYGNTCAASGYQWVTLPLSEFDSILSKAQAYEAGGTTSPPSSGSSSSSPDPEVIAAISVMFGAVLTAMAAIWALKRLYRVLTFRESSD